MCNGPHHQEISDSAAGAAGLSPIAEVTSRRMSRRGLLAGAGAVLLAGCASKAGGKAAEPAPVTTSAVASPPATSAAAPSTAPAPAPTIDLTASPAAILERSHIPVLCYHQIREYTPKDSAVDKQYIMPQSIFLAQLDALKAGGYTSVSPDEVMAHITTGAPLPDKPVMLSFDDSLVEHHSIALPELQTRDLTATFFIMTVVLGKERYLSKPQVAELAAAPGMTVAAHTWDHHRVDRYAGDDWKIQLVEPKATIETIIGKPVTYFAYPFGVWNAEGFSHLTDAGYTGVFQLNDQKTDPTNPLLTIQRAIADPRWSTTSMMAALQKF